MATNQLKIAMQNIIENKMVEYISTIKAEYGSGVDENKLRELWQDSREQMASKFTPIFKEAICITIGENSENHVGMEMYGRGLSEKGFSMQDLRRIQEKMEKLGGESELIMLSDLKGIDGGKLKAVEESGVLLLKKGVDVLLKNPNGSKKVYEELLALDWDKKY